MTEILARLRTSAGHWHTVPITVTGNGPRTVHVDIGDENTPGCPLTLNLVNGRAYQLSDALCDTRESLKPPAYLEKGPK